LGWGNSLQRGVEVRVVKIRGNASAIWKKLPAWRWEEGYVIWRRDVPERTKRGKKTGESKER